MKNNLYHKSKYNLYEEVNNQKYLFNTLTRSVIKIDRNEIDLVNKILNNQELNNHSNKIENYRNILINQGFLTNNENEIELLELLFNKTFFNSDFLSIKLVNTFNCNFKCPYCFEVEKKMQMKKKQYDILKAFSKNEFPQKKHITIQLFGGEPLIDYKNLNDYLDYVIMLKEKSSFNFNCTLTTNGYLLSEEIIAELVNKYYCQAIQITLDGNQTTHDQRRITHSNQPTFITLINKIKLLVQYKINNKKQFNILIRFNLINNTIDQIKEVLDFFNMEERQNIQVFFRPIFSTHNFNAGNNVNKTNLEGFYNLAYELKYSIKNTYRYYNPCEAGNGENTFTILPDLTLWKCMNNLENDHAKIGFIDNSGKLHYNLNKLAKWFKASPFLDKKCQNCTFLPLCWGACPMNYINTKQRTCFHEKKFSIMPFLKKA